MSQPLTGLSAWLVQRLSAVYMALFTMAALLLLLVAAPHDFATWRALFAHRAIAAAVMLFFIALLLHAWVGVRDVILDYAGQRPGWRLALLALLGAWLMVLAVWMLHIVLGVLTP